MRGTGRLVLAVIVMVGLCGAGQAATLSLSADAARAFPLALRGGRTATITVERAGQRARSGAKWDITVQKGRGRGT